MATLNGLNYKAAYVDVPASQIPSGEYNGKLKVMYDSHTFAADVNAIADIIKLGKLPKGARVVDVACKTPSLGTTGILSVGWAAGAGALEAADADGFIVANNLDAGGQAVLGKASAASVGLAKKFLEEVDIQAVFTEASDAAEGLKLEFWISYVQD